VERLWRCGALEGLRVWPDGEIFSFESVHPAKLHHVEHFGFLTEAKKASGSNDLSQQRCLWQSGVVADEMAGEFWPGTTRCTCSRILNMAAAKNKVLPRIRHCFCLQSINKAPTATNSPNAEGIYNYNTLTDSASPRRSQARP
jgi:hypothetical protein